MSDEEKKKETEEKETEEQKKQEKSQESDSSIESSSEKDSEKQKDQEKEQNRQLRNFLIVLGLVLVLTLASLYIYNQPEKFQYKNLEFESYTDKGGITFFREGIPQFTPEGEVAREELFYLRTHPDKLKNISFNGSIEFEEKLTISTDGNAFRCDGYGAVATGNVANLYGFMDMETETTQNTTKCDPLDNTANLRLVEGNETSLSQTGPACYKATIADCDILPPTEKFMAETISQVHKNIDTNLNRSS